MSSDISCIVVYNVRFQKISIAIQGWVIEIVRGRRRTKTGIFCGITC